MEQKSNGISNIVNVLPHYLSQILHKAPDKVLDSAQEIILRSDRPLCVISDNKHFYFTSNGCVTDSLIDNNMVICSRKCLNDTFVSMCNYSVYAKQNEINNGYITLKGGHRAGICGTAVVSDGKIINIKDITTINIRVAREIKNCSDNLYRQVDALKGVLICGAPCSGKTTILRDFARKLSYTYKVSLIDERNELSSCFNGVFQNDVGMCDVYDSYIKSDAITQSVRTMSSDIIVCDEVSTLSDVDAIVKGVNCGVAFVATMHATDLSALRKREFARRLISTGAFETIVFLSDRKNAGVIKSVTSTTTVFGS